MQQRRVTSENLQSVGYDPRTKDMRVYYRSGGIYTFHGVPKRTVDGLLKAASKTKFMQKRIEPKYDVTRNRKWRTGR